MLNNPRKNLPTNVFNGAVVVWQLTPEAKLCILVLK